jgi:hypothetical protein
MFKTKRNRGLRGFTRILLRERAQRQKGVSGYQESRRWASGDQETEDRRQKAGVENGSDGGLRTGIVERLPSRGTGKSLAPGATYLRGLGVLNVRGGGAGWAMTGFEGAMGAEGGRK